MIGESTALVCLPYAWTPAPLKSRPVSADKLDMGIAAIALQGLEQAQVQLDAAASNIAITGAVSAGPNLDTVDLSKQIVALNSAQTLAEVSVAVLKTADQIQQSVLNLLA